jgi:hypothetical protein
MVTSKIGDTKRVQNVNDTNNIIRVDRHSVTINAVNRRGIKFQRSNSGIEQTVI